MNDYKALADLLYPNVVHDIEYLENKYPKRNLIDGAEVCRFAPSPTGRMHMGNLFASFIAISSFLESTMNITPGNS